MLETLERPATNERLLAAATAIVEQTVQALHAQTAKSLTMKVEGLEPTDAAALLDRIQQANTVIRVAANVGGTTALLSFVLGAALGERLPPAAEMGKLLGAAATAALQLVSGDPNAAAEFKDSGSITPGQDPEQRLTPGAVILCQISVQSEQEAEQPAWIVIERALAERWNQGPLAFSDADFPAAPIRGRMGLYLADPEVLPVVRTACRRIGLEIVRYPRAAVPNPAAHKGEVVFLDVPSGDLKRLEWCKRLKASSASIQVVLLLHHPSRSRVIQGFLAGADVIVGWPVQERELAPKLGGLLPDPEPTPSA